MLITKSRNAFAVACLFAATFAYAQDATTRPTVIKASDKAAIEAAKETEVTVEGTVSEATWSNSGKVMNIRFADTDESQFSAVVFSKNKEKLDAAFGGDLAKALTGAKVRIKGKIREFTSKGANSKPRPEITISDSSQITIVEPAASQPAA